MSATKTHDEAVKDLRTLRTTFAQVIDTVIDQYGRCTNALCGMLAFLCFEATGPCCDQCLHPRKPRTS